MRGSTPLDVAAASCIDNNELALALQEQDLEMVCKTWESVTPKKNTNTSPNLSCCPTGGDLLGWLWAPDVSNAPF